MTQRTEFTVTEDVLASHSQRFLNFLLDTVMQVLLLIVVLGFALARAEANGNKEFMANFEKNALLQYTYTACVALFYYNVFEILSARTVGKWITQTIVVDANGEKPNHETIMIRSLCRLIPFNWISFIGYPARGWHDRISKTYVVDKNKLDAEKQSFYTLEKNNTDQQDDYADQNDI